MRLGGHRKEIGLEVDYNKSLRSTGLTDMVI